MDTLTNLNNTILRVKPMTVVFGMKWACAYSIHRLKTGVVGKGVARG